MIGSHIDTVINAGQYDGCLGVISSIEVIKTLKDAGMVSARPIVAAAFTNEEGVRYSPDMMGSLVYAGGMDVEDAQQVQARLLRRHAQQRRLLPHVHLR